MIEEKIRQLGLKLPEAAKPLAAYIPALQVDELIFTSGQLPFFDGELKFKGKVGAEINDSEGSKAAEICALNCLSAIKSLIGDLELVERVIKLTVFVNSAAGYSSQPKIANGASELIVKIFGESGKHVRSAVGVNELPLNAPVEIEMIVKIKS